MKLTNYDTELLQEMLAKGYIYKRKHPLENLWILNYSPKTQFEFLWNEATLAARGLIIDADNQIVKRPFKKFFTFEQLEQLRNSVHNLYGLKYKTIFNVPFKAYEKMDGSLGILYHIGGVPLIATRGSFDSPQAHKATEIYHAKYYDVPTDNRYTYLFEIVYPQNRIVVDYGATEDLYLIAKINTLTGEEVEPTETDGFPLPTKYHFDTLDGLMEELNNSTNLNREGFVLHFEHGLRVKFKFEEYKRLHRLMTGINEKDIWELLKKGEPLDSLLERVPDEFYKWLTNVIDTLKLQYELIESEATGLYAEIQIAKLSKKDVAIRYEGNKYRSIVFAMMDGKDYSEIIWKMIQPEPKTLMRISNDE